MPLYFVMPARKYVMLALTNAKSMRQNIASAVLKSAVPALRNAERWLKLDIDQPALHSNTK